MNEGALLANLLNHPEQIDLLDIKPEWFEFEQVGLIANAIKQLKGDIFPLQKLVDELKDEGYTFDLMDLEKTKQQDTGYSFSENLPFIKKRYYEKEILDRMKKYQEEGRRVYLNEIESLTEELEALRNFEDDGLLESSIDDFKEELYSTEKISIDSFKIINAWTGGGFRPGQLVTIGARSGVGKTLVAINFMMDFLKRNKGMRTAFFSLEMSKLEIMDRILSNQASVNSLKLVDKTNLTKEEKDKCLAIYEKIANEWDMALFDENFQTLQAITRKIRERRKNFTGKFAVFVDYAGLINVEGVKNGGDSSGRIKMNIITRELKLLASELKCTIFLLAQLNRGLEYRQDKRPGLQDLKESGSLEQDSSMVFFISKDEEEKTKAYLDIAKNRVGMCGRIDFYMNPSFMEFYPEREENR